MTFTIFYGDGSEYVGPPQLAPTSNCQMIIQPLEDERLGFVRQRDWYWWEQDEQRWSGGDFSGLLDYLWRTSGWQKVLQGRTINSEQYNEIYQRAKALVTNDRSSI